MQTYDRRGLGLGLTRITSHRPSSLIDFPSAQATCVQYVQTTAPRRSAVAGVGVNTGCGRYATLRASLSHRSEPSIYKRKRALQISQTPLPPGPTGTCSVKIRVGVQGWRSIAHRGDGECSEAGPLQNSARGPHLVQVHEPAAAG